MMAVKEFLKTYKPNGRIRPHALLADGWIVSIQATDGHYARRRGHLFWKTWTHVELGYIRDEEGEWREPDMLAEFYDGGGVWGYVPMEKVQEFVDLHGGIVGVVEA